MSDGPHRSLPMRRVWKQLALRADKRTYTPEQVREAVPFALASDWKNEVSSALISALKRAFSGHDNSLGLREIALDQIEAARPLAAGSVFGTNAVSWCAQLASEGRTDQNAFYEAVGLAAKERGFATCRQAEEHYLRESTHRRAGSMSARMESALNGFTNAALGTLLVGPQPVGRSRLRKQTGLHEGVPLP